MGSLYLNNFESEMVHDFIWVPATSILVMDSITVGVLVQITVMGFAHTAGS